MHSPGFPARCCLVLEYRAGAVATYFLVSFPAQALWLVVVWRMRFWLKNHLATVSSDPMPDTCWKWGYFYFNPRDPCLVVPLRTGVGQSFNYARSSVWVGAPPSWCR